VSKTCDEIEDWFYRDGEDLPKNAYVERKSNLYAVIAPIKHRLTEFEGREPAFESLATVLNIYQKIVGECEANLPDSKHAHLEADDAEPVEHNLLHYIHGYQYTLLFYLVIFPSCLQLELLQFPVCVLRIFS